MAVEAARGCGTRKVGGLYLTGSYVGVPCCRFPAVLDLCPTCGGGVKFTRSIQWVDPALFFKEPAMCVTADSTEVAARGFALSQAGSNCAVSRVDGTTAALMWCGEAHYKTPEDFLNEAETLGISKRLSAMPKGMVLGKTRVFLAHKKAVPCPIVPDSIDEKGAHMVSNPDAQRMERCPRCDGKGAIPGVFASFIPQRFERVVTETMKKVAEQWVDLEQAYESARDLAYKEGKFVMEWMDTAGPGSIPSPLKPDDATAKIVRDIVAWFRAVAEDIDAATVVGFEWVKDDLRRGVILVAVPDDDPDHAARPPNKRRALPTAPARVEEEPLKPKETAFDAFGGGA